MFTSSSTPLATGGCSLQYIGGDLTCVGAGGPVGAILPSGTWYDLDLPFRYPFVAVLQRAAPRAAAGR
jgi:hypothetical protein